MADLLGGTTGQVLKKNSNTNMDFVWAADSAGMTNPMTTTGDTIYSSSGSTPARLGIGTTGQVLTVAGGVPVWAAPAGGGKLLQVVSATTTTQTTLTTASYTDTTITATITPTLATSKILVMITAAIRLSASGGGAGARYNNANAKIMRGATDVFVMDDGNFFSMYGQDITEIGMRHTFAFNYLDSPATTSATTYKVQANNDTGSLIFQVNSNTSQIILMEIGA
jgi:hypothetical protein